MFIANWREASRWWSLRVSALGSILFAAMGLLPDQLLALWNMMPAEVRNHVPSRAGSWIGMILFVLVFIARLLPQRSRVIEAAPALTTSAPLDDRDQAISDRIDAIVVSPTPRGWQLHGSGIIRGTLTILTDKAGKVAARAAGAAGATTTVLLALSLAVTGLKPDEGKQNVDYLDIVRVPTACYGHTGPDVQVGRYRTDAECELLLRTDAREHLMGALACSPELADHPNQLAAVTRLTFNIGVRGYCGSTIARLFKARRWRDACNGFLAWRFAGGREIRGLLLRRQRERIQCLTGLPA